MGFHVAHGRSDGTRDGASSSPGGCSRPRAPYPRRSSAASPAGAFLVLDLGLDILNEFGRLNLEGDLLASYSLHEDFHSSK